MKKNGEMELEREVGVAMVGLEPDSGEFLFWFGCLMILTVFQVTTQWH